MFGSISRSRNIHRILTREQFYRLLQYAQSKKFSTSTIIIEGDIRLSNEELQTLITILKHNPKARATFTGLSIHQNNSLTELPDLSAFKITALYLNGCGFTAAPDVTKLVHLEYLYIAKSNIHSAPDLSRNLKLQELSISGCPLNQPPILTANSELKQLNISGCGLLEGPTVEFCPKLNTYIVQNNSIVTPTNFKNNKELLYLSFHKNHLSTAPDVSMCHKLIILNLSYNKIRHLGNLPARLRYLSVECNLLETMADASHCTKLESLCIHDNKLSDVPNIAPRHKIEYLYMINNPLTLIGKIYAMSYMGTRIRSCPFDVPSQWEDDPHAFNRFRDFNMLAKKFQELPQQMKANLLEQGNFEAYKLRYFESIVQLLTMSAPYVYWEHGIFRKILAYCVDDLPTWIAKNIDLLKTAFANNQEALAVINRYITKGQDLQQRQLVVMSAQLEKAKIAALVQFKRHQQANASALQNTAPTAQDNEDQIVMHMPTAKKKFITASCCVVS